MRLVPITSASKPSIAINAYITGIVIDICGDATGTAATQVKSARSGRASPHAWQDPPSLAAPPANEWFNPVHLRRRNRDGNEESTGRICDEVRRIDDYGGGRVSRVLY